MTKNKIAAVSVLCFLLLASAARGQANTEAKTYTPVSQALYDTIAHMDSVLFDAFNNRKVEKFDSLFTKDLEFYHDKGGLTGYQNTIDFMKSTAESKSDLHRELVPGSLEVYPINGYGAVQIGSHRFCHTEGGKEVCGTFKFIHVWKRINNEWKISRVISYDH